MTVVTEAVKATFDTQSDRQRAMIQTYIVLNDGPKAEAL